MNEDLTDFIIRELGKPVDHGKIIRRVCKKTGLNWREAERLVVLIEARHYRTIATRRTPLLLFLSIGALFLGIGLLAYNLGFLITFFQEDALIQALSLKGSRSFELLSGFGITLVGMLGLWKALGYIFPH